MSDRTVEIRGSSLIKGRLELIFIEGAFTSSLGHFGEEQLLEIRDYLNIYFPEPPNVQPTKDVHE